MGRPRNPVPTYLLHKPSGQVRIHIDGRDIYLSAYGSPESKKEYDRVRAELAATAPTAVVKKTKMPAASAVAEVVAAFLGTREEALPPRRRSADERDRWLQGYSEIETGR